MDNWRDFFRGKRVTVLGLGLLGRGVGDVKFLAAQGAELIVTDLKTADQLKPSLAKLKKFPKIVYHLGGHRLEDFSAQGGQARPDFILKAAGVPLDSAFIAEARKNKIPVLMSTALFAQFAMELGAKIIGVTGTRGKSTTTQLIYEILSISRAALAGRQPRVWLGGNVRGVSTLALLPKIKSGDWVVLELDSWQLQGFGDLKISPQIAVFTNLLPDHLNYYHGSMERYLADKTDIFKHQKSGDHLIKGGEVSLPRSWRLLLPGEHNRTNAALAKRVAEILQIKSSLIKKVITTFRGVPGRLELIRSASWRRRGIRIYNDTTSTTPDALAAALRALGTRRKNIILIAGGADKGLDFSNVLPLIEKYCKAVILLPGTGTGQLSAVSCQLKALTVANLTDAVARATKIAKRDDTILFSPGFASFGLFQNEFDRGDQFNRAILKLR